ncbi:MAG: PEP-CTERM system histidine kinase PrsK [Deltaproteobacteria bacterium]|nr:PEP-CTERM system histidine kinase PrsK [Deltaproteobacteria bacterium]
MLDYSCILSVLSSLLAASVGAFAFTRNPRNTANIGFSLAMWSVALTEAGDALLIGSKGQFAPALGLRLHVSGQAMMAPSWLVFTAAFAGAGRRDTLRRWFLASSMLGIISLFFILQTGSPGFIALSGGAGGGWKALVEDSPLTAVGPSGRYFYIYLILSLVLSLVHVENTLRSSKGTKRREIKHVMYGTGGLIAFFIYLSSQALLLKTLTAQAVPLVSAVTVISVSMTAFFVARHRLLDVEVYVSRYVVCNSITVFGVGVYLISVAVVAHGIRYFNIPFDYFLTSLLIFVSALALFLLLQAETPRRRIEQFISSHFYRHKYEFKDKWIETIDSVGVETTASGITAAAAGIISKSMAPRSLFIWLYDEDKGAYALAHGTLGRQHRELPADHPALAQIEEAEGPFPVDGGARAAASRARHPSFSELAPGVTEAAGAKVCAPLRVNGELTGFILLGPDISGGEYASDDMDLLRAVCSQAAVQIKNATLSERLVETREAEVFYRMSSFVLHDLKNFTNSLSMVSENAARNIRDPDFQRDAISAIDSTVARMKGLISKLAQGEGMALRKTETDIGKIINEAVKKLGLDRLTGGAPAAAKRLPSVSADPEALESVFLNLLSNAAEAVGERGRVRIRTWVSEGFLSVSVADNGSGLPAEFMKNGLWKPFRTTKKSGFGVGLFQCKAIVEAHGGRIDAVSLEGAGATFTVRLPVTDTGVELIQIPGGARG